MVSAKGTAKRTDALTNRARILQAALTAFAERGLDLEMNEVAALAKLGVGTLYGHFANREDLLRAILQSVVEDALAQLRAAQAVHADDPRSALQALVLAGIRLQEQYRPLSGVLRDPRLMKLMDPSYGQNVRILFLEIPRDLFTQGMQMGIFRRDLDPNMIAVILMGAFISAIDLLGTYRSLDELAEQLTHSLLLMLTGNVDV
jgi:AcrR family transcriptional regulator